MTRYPAVALNDNFQPSIITPPINIFFNQKNTLHVSFWLWKVINYGQKPNIRCFVAKSVLSRALRAMRDGGVAKKWRWMTRGRGVTIPPKIDDVIYEQPLTIIIWGSVSTSPDIPIKGTRVQCSASPWSLMEYSFKIYVQCCAMQCNELQYMQPQVSIYYILIKMHWGCGVQYEATSVDGQKCGWDIWMKLPITRRQLTRRYLGRLNIQIQFLSNTVFKISIWSQEDCW